MRYLHPATLEVVRQLAERRLPRRRPHRARRVRDYTLPLIPAGPSLDVLRATLTGLQRLKAVAA